MQNLFIRANSIEEKSNINLFSDAVIREKNLLRGVRAFRNFCSWSGDPETFDLLEVYLQSPLFIQRGIDYFLWKQRRKKGSCWM